jgi:hypothetical protein
MFDISLRRWPEALDNADWGPVPPAREERATPVARARARHEALELLLVRAAALSAVITFCAIVAAVVVVVS